MRSKSAKGFYWPQQQMDDSVLLDVLEKLPAFVIFYYIVSYKYYIIFMEPFLPIPWHTNMKPPNTTWLSLSVKSRPVEVSVRFGHSGRIFPLSLVDETKNTILHETSRARSEDGYQSIYRVVIGLRKFYPGVSSSISEAMQAPTVPPVRNNSYHTGS